MAHFLNSPESLLLHRGRRRRQVDFVRTAAISPVIRMAWMNCHRSIKQAVFATMEAAVVAGMD